jgi:hypothetical protein
MRAWRTIAFVFASGCFGPVDCTIEEPPDMAQWDCDTARNGMYCPVLGRDCSNNKHQRCRCDGYNDQYRSVWTCPWPPERDLSEPQDLSSPEDLGD